MPENSRFPLPKKWESTDSISPELLGLFSRGKQLWGVLLRTFYGLCRVFSSKPSLSYIPMAILVILQDLGVSYGYDLVLEP